ncbi:VanZ family protein [Fictibacillus phosphorivorans]|uniref:VanZ family protein n=1 Tax=Fictibacillus phosphorivorans TaxID=1221500 RepID=UPI002041C35E|nr:VanZ family protein [Fictibacillus phosphorivorans]MCM3718524.1 VanZ family protein [Fictibacillus phosphorivorans]MCM3776120.1 VanZ family protein [Fictibacillus phosphorivorans]
MRKYKIYQWIPVLLIVIGVFYSSSQPYQKQDVRPEIGKYVDLEKVEQNFSGVKLKYAGSEVSVEAKGPASFIEFFIRKGAHFSVFFALGFFAFRAIRLNGSDTIKSAIIAFALVAGYATFDETHQNFTENRSPHVEDVMIDITGGITAIVLASLIYRNRPIKKKTSFRNV